MTARLRKLFLALGLGLGFVPAGGAAQTIVLDAEGARMLLATPRAAPMGTDPVLRLAVGLRRAGAPARSALDARDWSFARLLPNDRFLGVTPEGHLWIAALSPGEPPSDAVRTHSAPVDGVRVDTSVEGAVGSSPDGRHLVYCRGVSPDLEVFRADDGRVRSVTSDMAPVWSPAISADGRSVVFVSAQTGVPALYRIDADGPPRQLNNVGVRARPGVVPSLSPTPDALTPPLLSDEHIVFESRGAVHILDARGRPVRTVTNATSPVWLTVGRTLGVFRPGSSSPESIALQATPRAQGHQP